MFTEILVGLFLFGTIGIGVALILYLNGAIKKIDIDPNAPILTYIGTRSTFTDGYTIGLIKTQKRCANGCTRIDFFPTDIEQGEHKKMPPMQSVVVKDEFIARIPRGDDSSHREKVFLVDRLKADLPYGLRETSFGQKMSVEGQKAFIDRNIGDFVRNGDQAIHEAMLEMSRTGITKQSLAILKELEREKSRSQIISEPKSEEKEQ